MYLQSLSLRHFRNLGIQELDVPRSGVAIVGDNAQGKSNLLEAIYYLETLRSFRGARDDQLVTFGEDVFRVVGTVVPDGAAEPRAVAAAYQRTGRRKKVTVDGEEPPRLSDGIGKLGAVLFAPGDVELVNGGPSERRRFLDVVLSLNVRGYVQELQEYRRALAQRNALLKEGASADLVSAWSGGLIAAGAQVVVARAAWVARWAEVFAESYEAVSAGEGASMTYRPSIPVADADEAGVETVEAAFREALERTSERERRAGATVVGPHRDELRLRVGSRADDDELDLRDYGSGGQRRTAALALKIVEGRTIRSARGVRPLVLLDDVFAELDEGRSGRVLELMEQDDAGQVILTVPKEADVRLHRAELTRWTIVDGEVRA